MKTTIKTAALILTLSLSACGHKELSFKAQDALIVPGVRYALTIETLDSARTETVLEDCSAVPGLSVDISWSKEGDALVAHAHVKNDNPDYVIKSRRDR